MKIKKEYALIGLFILITLLVIIMPNLSTEYIKNSNLYINEIMASNNNTIQDDYGNYSDYIELYNGYNYDINLDGYYLSDSEFEPQKWEISNITIKSKEYLVIYASKKDVCNYDTRICHTNFNLSSNGEVVTLSDHNGNIISKVKYPSLNGDISYGYSNNKYIITDIPTPGEKNSTSKVSTSNYNYKLLINEYMSHNKGSHYDKNGNCYDWVELYNNSDSNVFLENVYISDDSKKLAKYRLPRVEIIARGYLVIYFSGEDKEYKDVIYANFKLSDNESIIISDGKKVIDSVKITKLQDNVSYGLVKGKWQYFFASTPGMENNTASFDIGGNNGNT